MVESPNDRERLSRLRELAGYHRQMGEHIEREQNEEFRTAPRHGLRRAIIREQGQKGSQTPTNE